MSRKLAFLFGSGISAPCGYPATAEITRRVLAGVGGYRDSKSTYWVSKEITDVPARDFISVTRILSLLKIIKIEIGNSFKKYNGRQANYEDLFYIVEQMFTNDIGDYENPIVDCFINKYLSSINKILHLQSDDGVNPVWDQNKLFGEASNYVSDIVWRNLDINPYNFDSLACVTDACLDEDQSYVPIFTLNHDTLLETIFRYKGISINDGFGEPINYVRYWNPSRLEDLTKKVVLIKLHGSISWFRFPKNEYSSGITAIGIPIEPDHDHTCNPKGEQQYPEGFRPIILVGSFNKMFHYTSDIFADNICYFRNTLRKTDDLIVCGYGFGDKGINSSVVEWMYQSNDNRLTIIHPDSEGLIHTARGIIKINWRDWENQGRVKVIKRKIENTTWKEIKDSIQK